MLSIKRFFTSIVLLLFITFGCLYFFSRKSDYNIDHTVLSINNKINIKNAIQKELKPLYGNHLAIFKVNLPKTKFQLLEVDEPLLHHATLLSVNQNSIQIQNWMKCKPSKLFSMDVNPYFTINDKNNTASANYLVLPGTESSYHSLPLKLYTTTDYYAKKSYLLIIRVLTVVVMMLIIIGALFTYIRVKTNFTLFFLFYSILSFISSLLLNGFTNDFWPFTIHYVTDHAIGVAIGGHLVAICTVAFYYLRKIKARKVYLIISAFFCLGALFAFSAAFFTDNYLLAKYQIFYSLLVSLIFLLCYPDIFRKYRNKEAYRFNYLGILCYVLLAFVYSAKFFSFITPSITLHLLEKILFLSHLFFLFYAFLLISRKKLINSYVVNEMPLQDIEYLGLSAADHKQVVFEKDLANLSEREYEVLELIAKGMKDQEIADKLFVSISTAKTHKQRIYRKLNINNKAQATQIYTEFNSKSFHFSSN